MSNSTFDVSRRGFIKTAGAGAVALGSVGTVLSPHVLAASGVPSWVGKGNPSSQGFWNQVRSAFTLDPRLTYMNIGTTGSMPRHVQQAYTDNIQIVARNPRENFGGTTPLRETLAPQYGCDADEIVISGNTTDGMCMTLNGLVWEEDDAIITTNHEHPAGLAPMSLVADRFGVAIYQVLLPVGGMQLVSDYVQMFQDAIDQARADNKNPKLLVFSAPTFVTGTMLPIRELADLAIDEGIYTLVDCAHATGMFNLDFHALGADFIAASGHKWQCGPGGTGIWYIRNQESSNPLPLPLFYPTRTSSFRGGNFGGSSLGAGGVRDYNVAAFNQSHGNPNYPELLALVDSANFWDAIGRQTIEDHILGLSAYLKDRIISEWGDGALTCPTNPDLASALTSFVPLNAFDPTDAGGSGTFVTRLREEYRYHVRNTNVALPGGGPNYRPLRVSTHLFHDMRDVDGFMDAAIDLANKMEMGL